MWAAPGDRQRAEHLLLLVAAAALAISCVVVQARRRSLARSRAEDGLTDGVASARPGPLRALLGFHGTATMHVPATTGHAAVIRVVGALQQSGGTALGDAVLTSLTALRTPEDEAVGPIVLPSDGGNTAGSRC